MTTNVPNYITFQGKRKESLYYHGGDYLYLKSMERGETTYLKCQVKTCQATAVVRDRILIQRRAHNHTQPSMQEIEDIKRLARVKDEAERTFDGPGCSQIYDEAVTWSETSSTGRAEARKRRQQTLASMRQRRSRLRRAEAQ